MYFEIDESKPDITPVGSVMSSRDGGLVSLIVHAAAIFIIIRAPQIFTVKLDPLKAQPVQLQDQPRPERFVFVQPRVEEVAKLAPKLAEASDENRVAKTVERPKEPTNPLPMSRGNTRERVDALAQQPARGRGPAPDPAPGQMARGNQPTTPEDTQLPESHSTLEVPSAKPLPPQAGLSNSQRPAGGRSLGDTLRNLQRYTQSDQFDNPQGSGGQFGPAIQFDTKGVEFGPWVRRFIAQVKSNWLIPYAAMTAKGHVVVTFNVHKNGSITDLSVVGPSGVGAFNSAAYGALASSNPTAPLPPEYPADEAFFTVTFFYNEEPK